MKYFIIVTKENGKKTAVYTNSITTISDDGRHAHIGLVSGFGFEVKETFAQVMEMLK